LRLGEALGAGVSVGHEIYPVATTDRACVRITIGFVFRRPPINLAAFHGMVIAMNTNKVATATSATPTQIGEG
jgi:hypothetical protein